MASAQYTVYSVQVRYSLHVLNKKSDVSLARSAPVVTLPDALECICRLGSVGLRFYSRKEMMAYRLFSYFLAFCIVCFGPIIGVVAAGIEFGAYDRPLAEKGERCRVTASYVRLAPCRRLYIITPTHCCLHR